jgi:hypothetical protein
MGLRGIPNFCLQWSGCSTLFGRSSHCVFQSGLLWNTSVTCDASAHRQDRPSGTVSECWYNLTCFILQGELVMWIRLSFSAKVLHSLVLSVSLPSSWVISLQSSLWCADLSLATAYNRCSSICRIHTLRELRYSMVLFKFYCSCRCFYWDHALSLVFENITLKLWATPMQILAWIRLSSKSMYMYQLVVLCREMLASRFAWRYSVEGQS